MQIDLYPASEELTDPQADLLALLEQQGFSPTRSLVQGSVICPLGEQSLATFLTVIHQWQGQQPSRQVQPDELKMDSLRGEDPTLTITIHPPAKAATTK